MVTDARRMLRIVLAIIFGVVGIAQAQDLPTTFQSPSDAEPETEALRVIDHRDLGNLLQWSRNPSYSGGPDLSEPLVSDRPDFTEASSTVGRGVSQYEVGYTYTYLSLIHISEPTRPY